MCLLCNSHILSNVSNCFLELNIKQIEPQHEKTNNVVSDQVSYKAGCTTTGDG